MNKPIPTPSEIKRLQESSDWVQRLNASDDQALVEQWIHWCESDPLNLPAFERMQSTWEGFPAVKRHAPELGAPAQRHPRRYTLIALAASVLLAVGAAGLLTRHYSHIQVFTTDAGEQHRETLADGSHLQLAPDSHVSTHFTLLRRDVQLERGQAFFAVAHNALRPFTVHVAGLTVTAAGTAFDVRTEQGTTVVTIGEGSVNITPAVEVPLGGADIGSVAVHARAGQQVTFSTSARRLSVASVDPRVAESWRNGILQFVSEPLGKVVDEVTRYSGRKIALAPALLHTRFTGTVSLDNLGDWLEALQEIFPVEALDHGDDGIQLRSRAFYTGQQS